MSDAMMREMGITSGGRTIDAKLLRNDEIDLVERVGRIIDYLRENRRAHPLANVNGYDLTQASGRQLLNRLRDKTNVIVHDLAELIEYKPNVPEVQNKESLLAYIRKHPFGVERDPLLDSYDGVKADIEALISEAQVHALNADDPKAEFDFKEPARPRTAAPLFGRPTSAASSSSSSSSSAAASTATGATASASPSSSSTSSSSSSSTSAAQGSAASTGPLPDAVPLSAPSRSTRQVKVLLFPPPAGFEAVEHDVDVQKRWFSAVALDRGTITSALVREQLIARSRLSATQEQYANVYDDVASAISASTEAAEAARKRKSRVSSRSADRMHITNKHLEHLEDDLIEYIRGLG